MQKKSMTFRVRGVPVDWAQDRLESFLAEQDVAASRPAVLSFARETHGRSSTATVTFERLPTPLKEVPIRKTWDIRVRSRPGARPEFLSLDTDFTGMTTLFVPPDGDHQIDAIAVPGLGGHAFGSFKDKASDHMWLRDALPFDLTDKATDQPMARVITYGYNSTIAGSGSTQSMEDIATGLQTSLQSLASGPSRRIVFIAHSLGGLIVKQVLIMLAQSRHAKDQAVLKAVYGIVFFGVPHHGMDVKALIPMAGDGPNRFLVESISDKNPQILHRQYQDFIRVLGNEGESEVVCFYETMESRTAERNNHGEWKMTGPLALLVARTSATNCRTWESGSEHMCAINRTHSEMVKFGRHDSDYDNACERLRSLARRALTSRKSLDKVAAVPMAERLPQVHGPHFFVPFPENRRFVGRERVVASLQDAIFVDGGPQTTAIIGLGGIGKTQVALQLAYYAKTMPGWSVFWLSALSMAGFEQACTEMAESLSIPTDGKDAKQVVKAHLESSASGRWLLIVDNADNVHTVLGDRTGILHYLPKNSNSRILFTTRTADVAQAVADDEMRVEAMSEGEATEFLLKLYPKSRLANGKAVGELLRTLTFLPLAISQAAAYMKRNNTPVTKYLSLLQDTDKEVFGLLSRKFLDRTRYSESEHTVATTWLVSFKQIQETDPTAAELLSFISQIEPRAIPKAILPRTATDEALVHALGTLYGYAFLSWREDGEIFDMHSLVHLAARAWVRRDGDINKVRRDAVGHLATIFRSDDWDGRETWRQYMPHVLKAIRGSVDSKGLEEAECWLGFWAGRCLRAEGRVGEAVAVLEKVVRVWETTLAEGHPSRLVSQYSLAIAYRANGQVGKAVELLEYVVKVHKTTLAEGHPSRLASQHSLAVAYQANGQVGKAIELLEYVVKVYKTMVAEGHPSRLASQHELAGAYRANGQVGKAVKLLEHVVKERKALAENHPDRLASQHALAIAYQANGETQKAVDLLKYVATIKTQIMASTHPSRIVSENALAFLKGNAGP